jgi:hypothetical protein
MNPTVRRNARSFLAMRDLLADPIVLGVFTAQATDTIRPRLAKPGSLSCRYAVQSRLPEV